MTIALIKMTSAAAVRKGRMRAAIIVDLAVGLATIPAFILCMSQAQALIGVLSPQPGRQVIWWSVLFMSSIVLVLAGTAAALLARLAARGQTPGLALVGLRWGDETGRPTRRRLLGEPQFWCAALPTVYVLLACLVGTPQFFVQFAQFDSALSTIGSLIAPTLVVGALAIVVLSRGYPGRLVART